MPAKKTPDETPAVPLPADPVANEPAVATLAIDAEAMSQGSDANGKGKAREAIREQAEKLTGKASEQARGFAAQGKERATGVLDELARMIDDAAGTVDDRIGAQYGQYARSAAGAVSGFADNLRGKEVDELVDDVREFVRKSPAVAIGTAAAIGFVLARVLRSGFDGNDDRGAV